MASATRRYAPLALGLTLLLAAALCDVRVADWVHSHQLRDTMRASKLAKGLKSPGDFRFTLAVGGAAPCNRP